MKKERQDSKKEHFIRFVTIIVCKIARWPRATTLVSWIMKWWAHSLQVFWKAKRISVSFLKQMKTSKSFFETGCHRINGFSPQHIKEPSIIYSLHWQWHAMHAWILHFFANWIWSLNLPSTSTLWCGFGARRWSIFHVFPSPESPGVNITHLYKTKKVYFLGLTMRLRNMRRSDIYAEYSDICRICGSCGWCASADVSAWPEPVPEKFGPTLYTSPL